MNVIQQGLQTYQTAMNIDAAKEERKARKEERAYLRERRQRLDAYSAEDREYIRQERQSKKEAETKQRSEAEKTKEQAQIEKDAQLLLGKSIVARRNGIDANFTDQDLILLNKSKLFNFDYLLGDEVANALQTADDVVNGRRPIESPEAAEALNVLLPEVQKGSDGTKQIKQVMRGTKPDHLVFNLDVDGVEKPATVGRGVSVPSSEVLQVPVDKIMDKAAAIASLREFASSEKGQNYFAELYNQSAGIKPEQEQAPATDIGKLIRERSRFAKGSPEYNHYTAAINKETDIKPATSKESKPEYKPVEDLEGNVVGYDKITANGIVRLHEHNGSFYTKDQLDDAGRQEYENNLNYASQSEENWQEVVEGYQSAGKEIPPELASIKETFNQKPVEQNEQGEQRDAPQAVQGEKPAKVTSQIKGVLDSIKGESSNHGQTRTMVYTEEQKQQRKELKELKNLWFKSKRKRRNGKPIAVPENELMRLNALAEKYGIIINDQA